jgi:hypothetical protein
MHLDMKQERLDSPRNGKIYRSETITIFTIGMDIRSGISVLLGGHQF